MGKTILSTSALYSLLVFTIKWCSSKFTALGEFNAAEIIMSKSFFGITNDASKFLTEQREFKASKARVYFI